MPHIAPKFTFQSCDFLPITTYFSFFVGQIGIGSDWVDPPPPPPPPMRAARKNDPSLSITSPNLNIFQWD